LVLKVRVVARIMVLSTLLAHRRPMGAHRDKLLTVLLLAGAWCLLGGCTPEDEAEFVLSGFERHEDCLERASPIEPQKFSLRERVGTVGVFMQTDFRLPSVSDTVYVEVYQPEVVSEQLGQPIELGDPMELVEGDERFDELPVARASLFVAETCPEILETFALRGAVVFDELDTDKGGLISGSLDAEALSVRSGEVVIDEVTGSWQFTVRVRRPYRHYPDEPADTDVPRGPEP
jgi:hypothetical protein